MAKKVAEQWTASIMGGLMGPSPEQKIKDLNLILPKAADSLGSYLATKKVGNLLYISGQISIDESGNLIKGKLGKELTTDDGYKSAKRCDALNRRAYQVRSNLSLTGFIGYWIQEIQSVNVRWERNL